VLPPQLAGGASAPLGGLLVALMGPHPLPFPNVDWENAAVRCWGAAPAKHGTSNAEPPAASAWSQKKLTTAWPELAMAPGTILVLPPAEKPFTPPPAALVQALREKLSFDWQLAIGQQPEVTGRWEPRFFKITAGDKGALWTDADAATAGRPLLPAALDLLAAHPRAGEFRWWDVEIDGAEPDGAHFKLAPWSSHWLFAGCRLSVAPPPQPIAGNGSPMPGAAPVPGGAVPAGGRRIVVPQGFLPNHPPIPQINQ
jgi:hypothetical protein